MAKRGLFAGSFVKMGGMNSGEIFPSREEQKIPGLFVGFAKESGKRFARCRNSVFFFGRSPHSVFSASGIEYEPMEDGGISDPTGNS